MAPSQPSLEPPPSPLLARLLPTRRAGGEWFDRASWLLFAGLTAVALLTFRAHGITWDEWPHLGYGDAVLDFYTSGFADQRALTFRTNYYYGGGYDLLGAVFRWFARPLASHDAIHLCGGLVGVLGVVGAWKLARGLAGPLCGFVAALLLAVNPVYHGHTFNNPKDLPFAVAYVWALHYLVQIIAGLPRPGRAPWWKFALCAGLAMSVRVAGVLLPCYLGLVIALWSAHQGAARRSVEAGLAALERLGLRAALATAGAWAVMLAAWPWALLDPLRRPFVALAYMSAYNEHKRRMPFAGEEIWNFDIGWNYLPHYFGLQLPECVVVLGLVGSVYGVMTLLKHGRDGRTLHAALALLTLGVAIWLPPVYAVVKGSILYDGYRHFLFVVPPLTVLAALMIDLGAAALTRRFGRRARLVALALVAAAGLDLAVAIARLHPHQVVYFNRFIGGLPGAHGNYDTDYYGNSYREAFTGLARHLWASEGAQYLDTIYYTSGCVSAVSVDRYAPPNFLAHKQRPDRQVADFFAGYTRGHCDLKHARSPIVARVRRLGVDLNVVRDLRGEQAERLADEQARARQREARDRVRAAQEDARASEAASAVVGAALPPDLAAVRAAEADAERFMGPALPPALAIERARNNSGGSVSAQ